MTAVAGPSALTSVEACQNAMSAAVRDGNWLRYLLLRRRWHELENRSEPVQPPPEQTTRDPWPDGFEIPGGAKLFIGRVERAGWEHREGYARSARRSTGRGIYRVHHYVVVQAARDGRSCWARWRCPVEGKPSWTFDAGQVNGWPAENLGMVTDAITAGAVS